MKASKSTFITIIVLLVIFLPPAVYGTYINITENKDSNTNGEFYVDGKLHFYDENGSLLSIYKCGTNECGYPTTIIDDDKYSINYYKDGQDSLIKYQNKLFALIKDGNNNHIYSMTLDKPLISYDSLKNYNTTLKNNLLIVSQNNKWGVISLDTMQRIIDLKYDFIGLKNDIKDNVLNTDKFIVLENDSWFLIDSSGNEISAKLKQEISDYNNSFIITKDNKIYDYHGVSYLENIVTKNNYIVEDYLIVITDSNIMYVYKDNINKNIGTLLLNEYNNLSFEIANNELQIYLDGNLSETLML